MVCNPLRREIDYLSSEFNVIDSVNDLDMPTEVRLVLAHWEQFWPDVCLFSWCLTALSAHLGYIVP